MPTNDTERDFEEINTKLKFPGRFDPRLLQNVDDVGDGFPGLQKIFRNHLYEGYMEKDIDLVAKGIKGTSVNINNIELQQLSNIEATTISIPQWGFVGEADQPVKISDSPIFVGLTLSGGLVTTSIIDGVNISAHDHSGGDKGVVVPFTSISGDIVYTQVDAIVDISGTGDSSLISRADHVHTNVDGSSTVSHGNLSNLDGDSNYLHSTSVEQSNWNKINSLNQYLTAHIWVDGGTQNGDGILLDAIGEKVAFSCKVPSNINTTIDGFISITYSSPNADAIDANLYIGKNDFDGSGAVSFINIENGTSFPFPNTVADRFKQIGYLINNINIDEDFTFLGKIELNEASRSITIYGIQFEFRAV